MAELWFPEKAQEFRDRFKESLFGLEERISAHHLQQTINQISVWPIFEALEISERSLKIPISRDEKKRIWDLKDIMLAYSASNFHAALSFDNVDNYSFRVVSPEDKEYLSKSLDKIDVCYNPRKKNAIENRLLEDTANGGTLIYFLEKDEKPVVYNKLFISQSKDEDLVFFFDAIENGKMDTDEIKHWDVEGKLPQLAYSLAFSVYLSNNLGIIKSIGLGDRELEEAGALLGCKGSYLLPDAKRKVGMPVNHSNKGVVAYQARLYKKANNKHRTLNLSKARTGLQLMDQFHEVYELLKKVDFNPKSKRFSEREQFLKLCSYAVNSMNAGSNENRQNMNDCLKRIEQYKI